MNEKCSLDNLSRYLRVIGLLSLIIILIIVVYYYLQSNRSKILEKYESYALRDCKVYFTEGDTNIKNCDITQETSNYTGSCSYRFDGWNEFDTYTDNDGKTITYPKKVYTQTRTNTNDFNNPMFTNNCFKAYTDETCIPGQPNDNCIPAEFEYNANNVVIYDEIGKSGNTAVGNNIYGGLSYSSMQFLNTADPIYNNTNLISSICDVPLTNTLGSLNKKVFYKFEFNATTNKLENITSVTLDSNQTTFSIVSSDNVLTNLPPRPTDASFYGIQYDATNRNLPIKIFKKNNIPRNVAIFKFNYMSYICTQSQIKNYMTARRIIIPEKFIKYGSSTTPNYSKNISVSNNMTIKKDWNWSDYSSADFNVDYSDMLKTDLTTSIDEQKRAIKLSYADREKTAEQEYDTAKDVFNAASKSRTDFATNNPTFSSLIGKRNATSTSSIFDYKRGYNTSSINGLNISIPQGAIATKEVGSDVCIVFPNNINGNVQYTINIPVEGINCDILMIGGGGSGGNDCGGGGGSGACIIAFNQFISSGIYTISVGAGAIATTGDNTNGNNGGDSSIGSLFVAKGGGAGNGGGYSAGGGIGGSSGGSGGILSAGFNNTQTSSANVVNSVTNIAPSNTTTYSVLGTPGGNSVSPAVAGAFKGGGGGGIGVKGTNGTGTTCGTGGSGIYEVSINSTTYNLRSHFTNNGTFGVQDGTTGNYYIGGGGGGGGWTGSGGLTYISGGRGGGGSGADAGTGIVSGPGPVFSGTTAIANTGGGGGGGSGYYGLGGAGGSGLVIIRFRLSPSISSTIEFIRGTAIDSNVDYKIGNYGGEFKIISSINNVDTDYVRITAAGAIFNPTGTSSWTTTSDRRIKENIAEASYDKCYENINNLGLYRFNYVEGFNNVNKDIKQLGFIAQEVKDIFPKSVLVNNNYNIADLLTIDITQINYTLYGAVKKLIKQNEDKDRRIKRLETLLNIEDTPIDTSNISIDTSNITIDTSNITIDTSNIVLDTSNIFIDNTEHYMNIYWQYLNGYTSNLPIDTSNINQTASNIDQTTSNITIDTSNISLDTSNIDQTTSNIATE